MSNLIKLTELVENGNFDVEIKKGARLFGHPTEIELTNGKGNSHEVIKGRITAMYGGELGISTERGKRKTVSYETIKRVTVYPR